MPCLARSQPSQRRRPRGVKKSDFFLCVLFCVPTDQKVSNDDNDDEGAGATGSGPMVPKYVVLHCWHIGSDVKVDVVTTLRVLRAVPGVLAAYADSTGAAVALPTTAAAVQVREPTRSPLSHLLLNLLVLLWA